MQSEFEILEHVFSTVSEAPREKWDELLDQMCPTQEIREKADKLLNANGRNADFSTDSFLDHSLYPEPTSYRVDDRIGNYRLIREIGQGGMGVVFAAEQIEPIRRTVAIKVIKPGFDSREVISRFAAERQALSLMDHPNIAKVIDAGSTEAGQPFFVMELVEGEPITRYCEQNQLSTQQKLELFIPVCHAIQHAHHKGIIHRDIKPSNVLVADYDGLPIAKVIDFGIAKIIDPNSSSMTTFTGFGQLVGTFEYMSPEQTEINRPDIDTRTDIYSLGVLLYELLVNKLPFDVERLRSVTWEEMLRIIREEDPPVPSANLTAFGQTHSKKVDRTDAGNRIRNIGGELDWIVMKAIEKVRDRRYETPREFANDIDRYLRGEAVSACPPSMTYRFKKFASRNKVAIATSAIVGFSMVLGLIGTSWQAIRATRAEAAAVASAKEAREATKSEIVAREAEVAARKVAEEAEKNAIAEADVAKAISEFLENDLLGLAGADSQVSAGLKPDPNVKLVTLLERALLQVDDRFADKPFVRSRIKFTLGDSFSRIGRYEVATELLEDVLEYMQENEDPDNVSTLLLMSNLAVNYTKLEQFSKATSLFEQVVESRKRLQGEEHEQYLNSINNLAGIYQIQNRLEDAERLHLKCLSIRRRVFGERHPSTVKSMNNLAFIYASRGSKEKAEALLIDALDLLREKEPPNYPRIAEAMRSLGSFYVEFPEFGGDNMTNYEKAKTILQEAIELQTQVRGPSHPRTVQTQQKLAQVYLKLGQYTEATPLFESTLKTYRELYPDDHQSVISAIQNLGSVYFKLQRFADAEEFVVKTFEMRRRKLGPDHPLTLRSMNDIVLVYRELDKLDESASLGEKALSLSRDVLGKEHPVTLTIMVNLAFTYLESGRSKEGIELLTTATASDVEFYGKSMAKRKLAEENKIEKAVR